MQVEIDERELGTILAALRHWQEASEEWSLVMAEEILTGDKGGLLDIATDGGRFSALTLDEVDALCERINSEQAKEARPRVGDRVKVHAGSHFPRPPLHLIGQEGTIVSHIALSPGSVVRFDNGEEAAFHDDELERSLTTFASQEKLDDQQTEAREDGRASPHPVQGAG